MSMFDPTKTISEQPDASPVPHNTVRRVRHKRRGTTYEVLGEAEVQISTPNPDYNHDGLSWSHKINEGDKLVIYKSKDGKLWARFPNEFEDGRFEPAWGEDE